jgi:hypothetical protein
MWYIIWTIYDYLVYFFQFWFVAPRKIWQPCSQASTRLCSTRLSRTSQAMFTTLSSILAPKQKHASRRGRCYKLRPFAYTHFVDFFRHGPILQNSVSAQTFQGNFHPKTLDNCPPKKQNIKHILALWTICT